MEDAYHGTFASPAPGQKRHADDDLENEQRLSKRFNLLNLGTLVKSSSQMA